MGKAPALRSFFLLSLYTNSEWMVKGIWNTERKAGAYAERS
jgi:hypothetical protein